MWVGEGQREWDRRSKAGSKLTAAGPSWGWNPQTMRLWPEPKSMLNWLSHPSAVFCLFVCLFVCLFSDRRFLRSSSRGRSKTQTSIALIHIHHLRNKLSIGIWNLMHWVSPLQKEKKKEKERAGKGREGRERKRIGQNWWITNSINAKPSITILEEGKACPYSSIQTVYLSLKCPTNVFQQQLIKHSPKKQGAGAGGTVKRQCNQQNQRHIWHNCWNYQPWNSK